jgi:hypothetical protein
MSAALHPSPNLDNQVCPFVHLCPWATLWPSYTPRHWLLFSSPSTALGWRYDNPRLPGTHADNRPLMYLVMFVARTLIKTLHLMKSSLFGLKRKFHGFCDGKYFNVYGCIKRPYESAA